MLEFRQVQTPEEMEQVQRLRYRVYCLEKKFLPAENYPDGIEKDEFDAHSVHFIAIESGDREKIWGTLRLILNSELGFPAEKHFQLDHPILNPARTVELSRLIVAEEARHTLSIHILMGLSREVYLYAQENGIDDCYAVLEESLLRLLNRLGLPFLSAGKSCWYMGADTSPTYLSVFQTEQVLARKNALFYMYLHEFETMGVTIAA